MFRLTNLMQLGNANGGILKHKHCARFGQKATVRRGKGKEAGGRVSLSFPGKGMKIAK